LKGILHPDDAVKAEALGVDGIWVSNHGGRQIEGLVPAIDALPASADPASDKTTVLVDSGGRSGSDVARGLALGADAVFAGKAFGWSLGAAGGEGPAYALELLRRELRDCMMQVGVSKVSDLVGLPLRRG